MQLAGHKCNLIILIFEAQTFLVGLQFEIEWAYPPPYPETNLLDDEHQHAHQQKVKYSMKMTK